MASKKGGGVESPPSGSNTRGGATNPPSTIGETRGEKEKAPSTSASPPSQPVEEDSLGEDTNLKEIFGDDYR